MFFSGEIFSASQWKYLSAHFCLFSWRTNYFGFSKLHFGLNFHLKCAAQELENKLESSYRLNKTLLKARKKARALYERAWSPKIQSSTLIIWKRVRTIGSKGIAEKLVLCKIWQKHCGAQAHQSKSLMSSFWSPQQGSKVNCPG